MIGTSTVPLSPLPANTTSVQNLELVLDRRAHTMDNHIYHQLLVKWADLSPELAT
jgi:hypothetical protein